MSTVKADIQRAVDGLAGELEELSRKIHDHPELGYEEIQASGWLSAFLESKGLRVERGVAGVPTGMAIHTREFADAAIQPLAHAGMAAAARTMAMTMYDLLADPGRVRAAKAEFARG